jgi:CRP/FNR family transcriptional regulator
MKVTSCTIPDLSLPLFENLTSEESEVLVKSMVKVKYKKGETIFRQGTFASHIVYVKDGLVKVFVEGCNESLVLRIVTPGNYCALSAVADENKLFPYSAKTFTDTEVLLVDIEAVRSFVKSNSRFASILVNQVSVGYNQMIGRFFCLTFKQLYGRLADILLCLSEKIFNSSSFELNFTREELGELTKMSSESVIRMLKKFKDDGIIEMEGKNITIKNFDSLRKISEFG